ncbi:MAG: SdrD B-like domain-containing protein [Caldilineaceae bacterium]
MRANKHIPNPNLRQQWSTAWHVCALATLLLALITPLSPVLAPAAAAAPAAQATSTMTLSVISARTEPRAFGGAGVLKGAPVTQYKYIINIDNTGQTTQRTPADGCSPHSPGYPESCLWPSVAGVASASPIYRSGDQSDFASGGLNLPNGRYLISVLADGYKIDGEHFTVPFTGSGLVTVEAQPFPLPDSTLRAYVFADVSPTNGTPDLPAEPGLAGFIGKINDYLGDVSTDVYGNPLCTTYVGEDPVTHEIPLNALDADMLPVVQTLGSGCASDSNGDLVIPHLGTNRYALYVVPPNGGGWIQTTTLEGNHDWDTWIMEGSTGYDTEFAIAGEPFPQQIFGFVAPRNNFAAGGTGQIKGVVEGIKSYTPPKGGLFDLWGGNTGTKIDHPIDRPWISLADLDNGDTAVYIARGNPDGTFQINNVPAGNYMVSWWDEPQNYNVNTINVTVSNGQLVDMDVLPLNGWWTKYEGYIFNDANRNGVKDPGEAGVPNFTLTMRRRDNSLMDRGGTLVTTDQNGYYVFENAYPLGAWMVEEAYDDAYYTTGITYQADNQPTPTTVMGAGVDVSVLPIIGLSGRLDWGVHKYDPTGATCNPVGSYSNCLDPRNGGIVGTVSYDTTRNELDPQYAAVEDWQPGIPGLQVNLYAPVACAQEPCDPTGLYQLNADGSYAHSQLLNTYVTENWDRPTGCIARDVDGNPLQHDIDEQSLPLTDDKECLEGFLQSIQFGPYPTDQGTPDANFGAAVDGNYGFGDACLNGTLDASDPANPTCSGSFEPLPGGRDYLVQVVIPNDAGGKPVYKLTREEDINIGNGDQIIPQVPPPGCAGAMHTVDVASEGTDGYPAVTLPSGVSVPASTATANPTFVDIGGSPYEGTQRPLCDTKLVRVNNGKSIVPTFNLFTDVPLPTRFTGLLVDDINFSSDPRSLMYGEKQGIPFTPVGIYDFTNRMVATVESDFNGIYDVLLPSTNRINCPTPSGVCAGMYRFVANDPGVPGRLNPNWRPEYRTIATEFEAIPGLTIPTDLAPTQVGITVESPQGQIHAVTCALDTATPQIFAVSRPYVNNSGTFNITGLGFGATKGTGQVMLDGVNLPTGTWSDTQITNVSVGTSIAQGPHQLSIRANNGQTTVNGLTFHVRRGSYQPNVYEVGPGKTFDPGSAASNSGGYEHAIQNAIDAAYASSGTDLVVVYPNNPDLANPRNNPRGAYYENLILYAPIKLQGVGPGGFQGNTFVPGSIIDGGAFGGDTVLADAWRTKLGSLTWDGNQTVNEGQVIYVLASQNSNNTSGRARQFTSNFTATIDGFDIRGGDQQGFPGNVNDLTGAPTGLPPGIETQGGAIFANAYARYLQITNNVVQNNGGSYGTIRIGTPDLPAPDTSQHNENLRIANNRVIANGGTNLAGGIGIFAGADNYEVTRNDICGNFALEYGGGLSHYGLSPNGRIHDNRVYFNQSNDEGGGIMISGQLPANPTTLSPGAGPVNIYNNLIQANMANDDGGGIRFLMAGNFAFNVYNNMIVNNVSTHEGGGIGLNDAPNVRVYNNTIVKNLTTATAVTSDGTPAPAGLSSSANSRLLQVTLPAGSPAYSNPLLFNNIFWDNRAGTRAGLTVTGIGLTGDASLINYWDLGVADGTGLLAPTNSIIEQNAGTHPYTTSPTNSGSDPAIAVPYDLSVAFAVWRQNGAFVDATLVAVDAPPNLMGDYHLTGCPGSPACNAGAASKAVPAYQQPGTTVAAPTTDYDNQSRPALGGYDAGADEVGGGTADLSITKTDGQTSINAGGSANYTIVVSNGGPNTAFGAAVVDNFPSVLTVNSWTCTATGGSSCTATGTGTNRTGAVTLLNGGSATFTANTTLASNAVGTLNNTASVSVPGGTIDPSTANNTATDSDGIIPPQPAVSVLDNFNRANVNTLGSNWSQVVVFSSASLRVNSNQAFGNSAGQAVWNGTGSNFGATQVAAFTFATAPNGSALMLKASGGLATSLPANFIRVRAQTNQVVVETTTTGGIAYTTRGTLTVSLANGDRLTAMASGDGSVDVWKNTTYVGHVATPVTGGGRIGIQLPNNARVEDFGGGTVGGVVVAAGILAPDDVMAQPNKVFLSLVANPTEAAEAEAAQAAQADATQAGTQDDALQRPYTILLPYLSNQ